MVVTHTHSLSLARALSLSLADGGGGQRCSRLSLRCLLDNSSSETFGNLDYGRLYSAGARFVPLCDGTIKAIVTTRAKYQAWNRTTESFLHVVAAAWCCPMRRLGFDEDGERFTGLIIIISALGIQFLRREMRRRKKRKPLFKINKMSATLSPEVNCWLNDTWQSAQDKSDEIVQVSACHDWECVI